ncbi:hypothetical protein Slin15195_G104230 [Septoria linicola]|uniref:Uncharacterized protein n=1 Tax=Septoria linicola TaxID=215465 RepID=A0A9Q9ENY8_9PEZI|nr:hypothetical protein Slin14017_G067270 [Septoria linicola]USW57104.1 hypothetical protein Slin15195_G104230 [Septoria linicola]
MEKANREFPRLGVPLTNVRVVHNDGETREVSKWDQEAKCDETYPDHKGKGLFGKLKAASGKVLKGMAFD